MKYSLYKRNGTGNYFVSFYRDGRRITKSTRCSRKADAYKAAQVILGRPYFPTSDPIPGAGIDRCIDDYLDHLVNLRRSDEYVKLLRARLTRMLEGITSTSDMTRLAMRQVADRIVAMKMAKQTQCHYLQQLKTFSTWLYDRGLIPSDVCQSLKKPRLKDSDRTSPRGCLTIQEFHWLIETTERSTVRRHQMDGGRRALLYRLAAGTGLRLGEISCLHTQDIGLTHPISYINLQGSRSKNGTEVHHPLSGDLSELLSALPHGRIFPRLRNSSFLKADLEDASIPYVDDHGNRRDFHSFRSYYITRLIENNTPLHVLQKLARHASPVTTMKHYAKVDPGTNFRSLLDEAGL